MDQPQSRSQVGNLERAGRGLGASVDLPALFDRLRPLARIRQGRGIENVG